MDKLLQAVTLPDSVQFSLSKTSSSESGDIDVPFSSLLVSLSGDEVTESPAQALASDGELLAIRPGVQNQEVLTLPGIERENAAEIPASAPGDEVVQVTSAASLSSLSTEAPISEGFVYYKLVDTGGTATGGIEPVLARDPVEEGAVVSDQDLNKIIHGPPVVDEDVVIGSAGKIDLATDGSASDKIRNEPVVPLVSRDKGVAPNPVPISAPGILNQQEPDAMESREQARRGASTQISSAADVLQRGNNTETGSNVVRDGLMFSANPGVIRKQVEQGLQQSGGSRIEASDSTAKASADINLASLLRAADPSAATAPVPRVTVPVGHPAWGQAVSEQVVWMVSQNVSSASIRLNPAHLGPLEMQVSLAGDQTNVVITSQHSLVREVLESALPRLREMFADSGVTLGNVQVSHQDVASQRNQNGPDSNDSSSSANAAGQGDDPQGDSGEEGNARAATQVSNGLIDYYI